MQFIRTSVEKCFILILAVVGEKVWAECGDLADCWSKKIIWHDWSSTVGSGLDCLEGSIHGNKPLKAAVHKPHLYLDGCLMGCSAV
jgi:hypothetical protein